MPICLHGLARRNHGCALDQVSCLCRFVTGTEWVTGASDGSLALWTQFKKKPVQVIADAHSPSAPTSPTGETSSSSASDSSVQGWIQSVAVCTNSDLVVRPVLHRRWTCSIALMLRLTDSPDARALQNCILPTLSCKNLMVSLSRVAVYQLTQGTGANSIGGRKLCCMSRPVEQAMAASSSGLQGRARAAGLIHWSPLVVFL